MNTIKITFLILSALLLTNCSHQSSDKNNIVVTIYPFKAILQEIVGNEIQVDVLLPGSADPHTYEMSPSDYKKIQDAKVFFYGAETLDGWAAEIDVKNKIELLKLIPEDFLLQIEMNDEHSSELNEESHHHYGVDPHFWTDPLTVNSMLESLTQKLAEFYPDKKESFKRNAEAFSLKLIELDKKVKKQIEPVIHNKVFSAHPFYNYFFKRYGIKEVGSLEISPGQQITPKFLKNISEEINRKNVKAIFINKQHISKAAKVLAESVGIKTIELDPIGGTKSSETYEQIILSNLTTIVQELK
ncbi:MAG: metal ABC transporter substrate-binding protein [Ignavibacterium album]|uniref:metal ABC transporter substrate-binding protein n=1 Tax=Ignavibacterium album TaxID=591197 RepID=UPI0026E95F7F|nr:metal ABC transporter substrate-binding protein [Ignavibacterium album]MCX8104783.1 metal ABC transporter substrate-binding protein [Ignavibacterium album]